ncbi:MAG: hypothetical protein M1836_004102 [Candelina mexicana]|nr:MAG: hypothetical protein M1836_004102 [Candelina mexicana]
MHGANYFRQKLARGYLIVSRILIISEALILRRSCFLDQEGWRTIPWMDDHRSKTSLDAIIELMACIPRLREESDVLQSMQTHILAVPAHEFRERLISFMAELFLWRWRYEQSHPGMAFEVSSEATGRNKDSPLRTTFYPTMFFFKNFDTGREPLLYNTALLMIFALAATWQLADPAAQAMAKLPQQEHPLRCTNPLSLPHARLRIEDILHENCRSFEFFLQGPHAAAGAMVLLLPLRFAYVYSKEERQKTWLSKIMKRISRTCGFGIFDKLTDLSLITMD